jgi:Kae1-associated kinase Bud32
MFLAKGAEATIELIDGMVIKNRIPKSYRLKALDQIIRKQRTKMEARIISESRRRGVPTPIIFDIENCKITMEYINGPKIKDILTPGLSNDIGTVVGRLHFEGIIHGDLTTSNMILYDDRIYMIDFGLAFFERSVEARGVDVHVLFRTFESTHDEYEILIENFKNGYRGTFPDAEAVLKRVEEIKGRGRYA